MLPLARASSTCFRALNSSVVSVSGMLRICAACRPFASSEVGHNQLRRPFSLLCLFWMKRRLLGLHSLDQFLDPIKHSLISDSGRHALVMLNLAVEFDALVTHFSVPHPRVAVPVWLLLIRRRSGRFVSIFQIGTPLNSNPRRRRPRDRRRKNVTFRCVADSRPGPDGVDHGKHHAAKTRQTCSCRPRPAPACRYRPAEAHFAEGPRRDRRKVNFPANLRLQWRP